MKKSNIISICIALLLISIIIYFFYFHNNYLKNYYNIKLIESNSETDNIEDEANSHKSNISNQLAYIDNINNI